MSNLAVLITGAAGGIGQALVAEFSAAGYRVLAVDCAPLPEVGPGVRYMPVDLARTVADEGYAATVFARVRESLGDRGLAALVNNAAVRILGETAQLSRGDWERTLDVNLLAPFFWTQGLLPELEAAHGCVLNVSSIHARLTKRNFVAYATSKAALSGLTRALAVDLGGRVRVNALEPAAIETPMLRAGFAGNAAGLDQLARFHPSGNMGAPEGLARLARQVVEGDRFLHGAVIGFDGGIAGRLLDPD